MPVNEMLELKALILEAARAATDQVMSEQGVMRHRTGSPAELYDLEEVRGDFAIGYDSVNGTSVIPFTLDVSILYAGGVSGDILLGS